MLVEFVTDDPRAGGRNTQKAANRCDGTIPDDTIANENALTFLKHILRENHRDVLVISHPRVLGQAPAARSVLEAVLSRNGFIKLPYDSPIPITTRHEFDAFMQIHKCSLWGVGTPKKFQAGQKAVTLGSLLTDSQKRIIQKYWGTIRAEENPNLSREKLLVATSKLLNRKIQEWEIEALCIGQTVQS